MKLGRRRRFSLEGWRTRARGANDIDVWSFDDAVLWDNDVHGLFLGFGDEILSQWRPSIGILFLFFSFSLGILLRFLCKLHDF